MFMYKVKPIPISYGLSGSVASINEDGIAATITLTTTGLENGTVIPYTITGVSADDLVSGSLTGQFVVSGNKVSATANVQIAAVADVATEGNETLTLTLDGGLGNISVVLVDTSMAPTYSLTRSGSGSVNEGGSFTITLTTANVANGVTVPYTITGVSSADLNGASLTGQFVVSGGTSTLNVTVTADLLTEGSETFVLALNNGTASISIPIADTSIADPYDKLLMHFDGTNGSTTLLDVTGKPVTNPNSTVTIDTGTKKFGTGSAYFNGVDSYGAVSSAYATDFQFGTGDFTIEFWYRYSTVASSSVALSHTTTNHNNESFLFYDFSTTTPTLYLGTGAAQYDIANGYTFSTTAAANTWHHCALTRSGGTFMMYFNGVRVRQFNVPQSLGASTQDLLIGARRVNSSISQYFRGHMDELRISKGIARYNTASFTLPTAPF